MLGDDIWTHHAVIVVIIASCTFAPRQSVNVFEQKNTARNVYSSLASKLENDSAMRENDENEKRICMIECQHPRLRTLTLTASQTARQTDKLTDTYRREWRERIRWIHFSQSKVAKPAWPLSRTFCQAGHVTGDATRTRTRMPGWTAAQESAPYASGGVNCLSDVTCLWRYKSSCPRHRAGQPSDYDFAHL